MKMRSRLVLTLMMLAAVALAAGFLIWNALAARNTVLSDRINAVPDMRVEEANIVLPLTTTTASSSVQTKDFIYLKGSYVHRDETVDYQINIPKAGGEFKGSFSGNCTGFVIGTYKPNAKGILVGRSDFRCKIGVFTAPITATYVGAIDTQRQVVTANYESNVAGIKYLGLIAINY